MKQIVEFPNYSATRDGRIWNNKLEKYLVSSVRSNGYVCSTLRRDGQSFVRFNHRLIGQTLIPNPLNLPEINHKNGIKTDNRVENLEWCSRKENIQHSRKVLGLVLGEDNGRSKLTEQDVLEIRRKYIPYAYSLSMLANEYHVATSSIHGILHNTKWSHI